MPVIHDVELEDGVLRQVTFDKSPIMSTYLLAFVVGELDYVEDTTKEGVKVRVYTMKGKTDQGTFALDVATKTLSFFSEYFDIAYPLPKMDMVAIPDFGAGETIFEHSVLSFSLRQSYPTRCDGKLGSGDVPYDLPPLR